eukprot:TRINITY_DN16597_c0_g2_i1.p2 TRINITY_DN16597_c0_g2~~TRINITY_DN16597_c0_g2_i1.p2  ORF type:complete len:155 (+),score=63.90 TRINITY_DN16597_c0_g2_i1:93-557(+)
MPLIAVPLSADAAGEADDAAAAAAAKQLRREGGEVSVATVERTAGCKRPRCVLEAPSLEGYLDVLAERDALRVKCDKLSEAFSHRADGKALLAATNSTRLLEAEVGDLRVQLEASEAFKADVMQRIRELKSQIACLTDELLRVQPHVDPPLHLP